MTGVVLYKTRTIVATSLLKVKCVQVLILHDLRLQTVKVAFPCANTIASTSAPLSSPLVVLLFKEAEYRAWSEANISMSTAEIIII